MENLFVLAIAALLCYTAEAGIIPNPLPPQKLPEYINNVTDFTKNLNTDDRYHLAESIIPDYFKNILPNSNQQVKLLGDDKRFGNVSLDCQNHMDEWLTQLANHTAITLWALQMVDAWGKFPEGILSGHTTVLGDFDECLSIRASINISGTQSNFKGKYCNAYISLNAIPLPFRLGTCFPSTCSAEDVAIFLQSFFEFVELPIPMENTPTCFTDDKPDFTRGDIAMIAGLGVLLGLCFLGTGVDLFYRQTEIVSTNAKKPGFVRQSIVAFSLYKNTMKWLSTKSSGDNLGSLHGIRFFSTCWVVLCHTWSLIPAQPTWNLAEIATIHKESWLIFVIINGTVAVDTFFALSGLLVAYGILKALDKTKGRLNVPMLYLHRYLRLTPLYAFLIGIMATWFTYLRTGPQWAYLEELSSYCAKNWWQNLLYINNLWVYEDGDQMCYGETWYLANDFQFFIISPLLIYPLWKWKRIGLIILSFATISSALIPMIITNEFNLIPVPLPFAEVKASNDYMIRNYTKPWNRIGPYLAGIWAGYFLYCNTKNKINISRLFVTIGWCASTVIALAIIFGIPSYFEPGAIIPKTGAAFYAGFQRLGWGVVISWIVVACTLGRGGCVNQFLSWKVFMPLGRLSFCVYLISYQLQLLFHHSVRQAVSYDPYTTTNLFFSHLVTSFLVSFVCCITMESPFIVLEKLIFEGGDNKRALKTTDNNNTRAEER